MAKAKRIYVCQTCGAQRPRWEGRCTDCGAWNSFAEEAEESASTESRSWLRGEEKLKTLTLDQNVVGQKYARQSSGFHEVDRVLGGGLVKGSYTLIGGDPGIGKSTLLLQMAGGFGNKGLKVLYVSGEESVEQTVLRAQRLGVKEASVRVAAESQMERILELVQSERPDVLVVDSIQTIFLSEISSAPGTVSQVRECAARLMGLAKGLGISVFLIGHVTKEGQIAGPKVLEHMVDTVLSFEGDCSHQYRLLRALKNRFGPTFELGVFQMEGSGLIEVPNPSEMFLADRGAELMGSAVYAAMEGSRPLLCEVQALTSYSAMAIPRRTSLGIDLNRVHLITAVLQRHLGLDLSKSDLFVNVVGGLRITEPYVDLAVAASILSSARQFELPAKAIFLGEIGLTGEIRGCNLIGERLAEARKLGFEDFYVPASSKKHLQAAKFKIQFLENLGDFSKALAALTRIQPQITERFS